MAMAAMQFESAWEAYEQGANSLAAYRASMGAMSMLLGLTPRMMVAYEAKSMRNIVRWGKPPKAGPRTVGEQFYEIGKLEGLTAAEAEAVLKSQRFTMVIGNNGGKIYSKSMPDGNTAAVRIDPAAVHPPKGFADEVPHFHKELVPTSNMTNGNYKQFDAIKLSDSGVPSKAPQDTHIPQG